MAWYSHETVVVKGSFVDDPMDTSEDSETVEIAVYELVERYLSGEVEEYDEGSEMDLSTVRAFVLDLVGFEKTAQDEDAEFQDWSDWLALRRILRKYPYRWIYRTYQSGTDRTTPIPRAGDDGTDSLWNLRGEEYLDEDEDYPFDPPGILPYPIRPSGELTVDRDGGSVYTGEIELEGEEYE